MKNLLTLLLIVSCTIFNLGCSKDQEAKNDTITNETEVTTNSENDDLKFYLPERIYMVTKGTLEGYLEIIDSSNGEDDAGTVGSLSVYTKAIKTNIENMNELYPNDPYAKELSDIMDPCIESLDKILNHIEGVEKISEEDIEICLNTIYDAQDKINSKISELEIDESIIDYK